MTINPQSLPRQQGAVGDRLIQSPLHHHLLQRLRRTQGRELPARQGEWWEREGGRGREGGRSCSVLENGGQVVVYD